MLQIRNIHKSFKDNAILKGIDLDVKKGEVVAILGPSGSGKTTFLRCLNLLERPDKGTLSFTDGSLTLNFSEHIDKHQELALRRSTSMVFQYHNLFPHRNVIENVIEGPIVVKKVNRDEAKKSALRLLKKVGLDEQATFYPAQLSGGQQQRVGIARALAMEPKLILLDEPTSALDPELVGEVLQTLRILANEGWTMIIVTHEMKFAKEVADTVVFMDKGKIVEQNQAKIFFINPQHERTKQFLLQTNMVEFTIDYMI